MTKFQIEVFVVGINPNLEFGFNSLHKINKIRRINDYFRIESRFFEIGCIFIIIIIIIIINNKLFLEIFLEGHT